MGLLCGIERKPQRFYELEDEIERLKLELAIEREARKKAQAKVQQIQNFFIEGNVQAAERDILAFDPQSPRRF